MPDFIRVSASRGTCSHVGVASSRLDEPADHGHGCARRDDHLDILGGRKHLADSLGGTTTMDEGPVDQRALQFTSVLRSSLVEALVDPHCQRDRRREDHTRLRSATLAGATPCLAGGQPSFTVHGAARAA